MSQARSAPPKAAPTSYDRDLYAWSLEQVRLLRTGQFDAIDAENVAEEILDVGKTEYRILESALRVLLVHMSKWDHQPERRSRFWEYTIIAKRNRVRRRLRDYPSLKARVQEAAEHAYEDARLRAHRRPGFSPISSRPSALTSGMIFKAVLSIAAPPTTPSRLIPSGWSVRGQQR